MVSDLKDFAETHYPDDLNKSIPLGLLKAYLFEHHDHVEEFQSPVVSSTRLEKWAKENAVERVVDRDGGTLNLFEHGWHKQGCKGIIKQQEARIQRVKADGHGVTYVSVDKSIEDLLRGRTPFDFRGDNG